MPQRYSANHFTTLPIYHHHQTTYTTQCLLSTPRNSLLALVLLPRALFLRCPSNFSHGPLTTWWPGASSGFLFHCDGYQSRQPPKPYSMRLRTGTCITPPAWISRFGSILHYASFLKQPLYFPNTFFTLRIYLMRRFRFNYTMYEVLVFLSIYRTCAGALVLILSTLRRQQPWEGPRFHFAQSHHIDRFSRESTITGFFMSMRCGDLGQWARAPRCLVRSPYLMMILIGYARHNATCGYLVMHCWYHLDWLLLAVRGGLGLGYCSLGSCCFGDYFSVFSFSFSFFGPFFYFAWGFEFIWINGMYNRVIYPTESLHCKLLSCIFTTWFSFQLDFLFSSSPLLPPLS